MNGEMTTMVTVIYGRANTQLFVGTQWDLTIQSAIVVKLGYSVVTVHSGDSVSGGICVNRTINNLVCVNIHSLLMEIRVNCA